MITLIIKGDIPAAFRAADVHGVELCALATHNKFREVIASTIPECLPKVIKWFCENDVDSNGRLVAGALMFYSDANPEGNTTTSERSSRVSE